MTRRILTIALLASGISVDASAQDRYVTAGGGATFGGAVSPLITVTAGAKFAPHLEVIGEFVYARNVMPKTVFDAVNDTAASFERFALAAMGQEIDVEVDTAAPTAGGAAGLRLVPWDGQVRGFLQIDAGFARVNPRILYLSGGQDLNLAPPGGGSETKPTIGIGGGVTIAAGSGWFGEARYRFTRIFAERAFEVYRVSGFNTNAVSVAIGRAF